MRLMRNEDREGESVARRRGDSPGGDAPSLARLNRVFRPRAAMLKVKVRTGLVFKGIESEPLLNLIDK
jgi:hypothetical protein